MMALLLFLTGAVATHAPTTRPVMSPVGHALDAWAATVLVAVGPWLPAAQAATVATAVAPVTVTAALTAGVATSNLGTRRTLAAVLLGLTWPIWWVTGPGPAGWWLLVTAPAGLVLATSGRRRAGWPAAFVAGSTALWGWLQLTGPGTAGMPPLIRALLAASAAGTLLLAAAGTLRPPTPAR